MDHDDTHPDIIDGAAESLTPFVAQFITEHSLDPSLTAALAELVGRAYGEGVLIASQVTRENITRQVNELLLTEANMRINFRFLD